MSCSLPLNFQLFCLINEWLPRLSLSITNLCAFAKTFEMVNLIFPGVNPTPRWRCRHLLVAFSVFSSMQPRNVIPDGLIYELDLDRGGNAKEGFKSRLGMWHFNSHYFIQSLFSIYTTINQRWTDKKSHHFICEHCIYKNRESKMVSSTC